MLVFLNNISKTISLTLQQEINVIDVNNQKKLSVRKFSQRFNIGKRPATVEIIKSKESLMKKWHFNV